MSLSQFSRRFLLSSLALSALCVGGCGEGAIPGIPGDVSTKLTEGVEEAEGVTVSGKGIAHTYYSRRTGGRVWAGDIQISQEQYRLSGKTVNFCGPNLGRGASVWLFKDGNGQQDKRSPVGIASSPGCQELKIDKTHYETSGPSEHEVAYQQLRIGPGVNKVGLYVEPPGAALGEYVLSFSLSNFTFYNEDLGHLVKVSGGAEVTTELTVTE